MLKPFSCDVKDHLRSIFDFPLHLLDVKIYLWEREEIVLGGASGLNVEVLLDGIQDLVGPAQPARGRRANLA